MKMDKVIVRQWGRHNNFCTYRMIFKDETYFVLRHNQKWAIVELIYDKKHNLKNKFRLFVNTVNNAKSWILKKDLNKGKEKI